MAKDLMSYLKGGDDGASADKPKPEGEGKDPLMLLAERTGVSNPGALIKLVKACMARGE
jgi:hypothetical protein